MYKVLPALRTVFLVFIIVYALWAASPWDGVTATVTLDAWHRLQRVTWLAIAWIAFETLLGWIFASFRKPRPAPDAPRPGATQPGATAPRSGPSMSGSAVSTPAGSSTSAPPRPPTSTRP